MLGKMPPRVAKPAAKSSVPTSQAPGDLDCSVRLAIAASLAGRQLCLEKVAEIIGVHPRTLQRRLAQVDLVYQQLVDEVRVDMAGRLLALSDTPIKEIANQLGYADPAHFSRAFHRWTGMSPRSYRRRSIETSARAR